MNIWYILVIDIVTITKNIAVFIFNLTVFLLPFGFILEKFGVCLKQETIIRTIIWELNETYQLDVMAT